MLALSTINKIRDGVSASKFATATCLSPHRVKVRLSETGAYTDIYCDCGRCIRCLDNKRDNWASRMFLHSLDYEYCYFLTLTYGSYNLLPFKQHPFLNDWLMTVPSYDSFNSQKRPAWTPSILCQSHFTKFMKRLRISLDHGISYAACGEYGSEFGRPHFHCIIWSHKEILPNVFEDAWSLECKRTKDKYFVRPWRESDTLKDKAHGYFRFRLGRIDVHDLWANGSLNYDGKHPGVCCSVDPKKNAMYNFTYIAKYIGKSDLSTWNHELPREVMNRIQYAYNILVGDLDQLAEVYPNPTDYQLTTYNAINNSIFYDYENYKNVQFLDFEKLVSPFFCSSRRPSIGKNYFLQHRTRFLSKEFGLPSFMGRPVSFPAYFTRLLQQEKYPVRLRKVTSSGVSLTKDLLPRLYQYMDELRRDPRYWFSVRGYGVASREGEFAGRCCLNKRYELFSLDGTDHNGTLDSVDLLDASGGVIHYYYRPHSEIFEGWKFDRSLREFVFVEYVERIEFCEFIMDLIENEYKDYPLKFGNMQTRLDIIDCIKEDPQTDNEIKVFTELRSKLTTMYNIQKTKIGL